MMMNLCILSLLIEDVVAMGGGQGAAAEVLLGKKTEEEIAPEVEEPEEIAPEVEEPEEITPAQGVSCGGHDAASCGECITAPGAPKGSGAASWCNGDCVTQLSQGQVSCVAIESGFVSCGHHQAENCESCTNKAVGHARFCNGACAFNDNTNICENAP